MKLIELVEKYKVTKVCEYGSCYEVGSKEYDKHKFNNINGFTLEEDFAFDGVTLNIDHHEQRT